MATDDPVASYGRIHRFLEAVEATGATVVDASDQRRDDAPLRVTVEAELGDDVAAPEHGGEGRDLRRTVQTLLAERERLRADLRDLRGSRGDAPDPPAEPAPPVTDRKREVLRYLHDHGGATAREIADNFDVNMSAVHKQLKPFRETGHVVDADHPVDARKTVFSLAPTVAADVLGVEDSGGGDGGGDDGGDGEAVDDIDPDPDWLQEAGVAGVGADAPLFEDFESGDGPDAECQHCGTAVTPEYARVFTPESEPGPRTCPSCSRVREADGTVRAARTAATDGGDSA